MAVRLNPNLSEEDLTEAGQRKAVSSTVTDEQVRDFLRDKARKAHEQITEPPITRPKDRLRPGVALEIEQNRKTRGVPEEREAPTACPQCGLDDHPSCPSDRVELRVIARNHRGEILDRACPVCGLRESVVVKKGLGAQLYPLAGFRASMDRAVKASLSTVRDA